MEKKKSVIISKIALDFFVNNGVLDLDCFTCLILNNLLQYFVVVLAKHLQDFKDRFILSSRLRI